MIVVEAQQPNLQVGDMVKWGNLCPDGKAHDPSHLLVAMFHTSHSRIASLTVSFQHARYRNSVFSVIFLISCAR